MKISKSSNTIFKKSFSLFELILTIALLSFVVVGTLVFQSKLIKTDKQKRELESIKLDLLSTKIYLEKNLQNLNSLKIENDQLYFDDVLLLKDITTFEKNADENYFYIKIVLNEEIKNFWVIKK